VVCMLLSMFLIYAQGHSDAVVRYAARGAIISPDAL
jgi:hypothetical protein